MSERQSACSRKVEQAGDVGGNSKDNAARVIGTPITLGFLKASRKQ